MLRRFSTIFTLSFLLVAFLAMTAFATKSPVSKKRTRGQISTNTVYYSYPDESYREAGAGSISIGKSSAPRTSAAVSPGTIIGDTWYDYQHNGTMGRMIDWGNDVSTGNAYIHSTWMQLPGAAIDKRHYAYRHYNATTGALSSITNLQGPDDFAGYVNLQAKGNGAAIVGGHNNPNNNTEYQAQLYYNFSPGNLFWFNTRVTDTVAYYGSLEGPQEVIWPKFAYQEGTDTVTHVLCEVSNPDIPTGIYYFRKVGANDAGEWDYPPYIVDTQNVLGQVITASKTSDKVAMAWLGRVPADGDCDTCSNNANISLLVEQSENDIYYQISDDQGATWNPRVNVTHYAYTGVSSYRAYSECSIVLDSNDDLHIVWPARTWAGSFDDLVIRNQCRMFHWSENVPFIRQAADNDWEAEDSIQCSGGTFELNISKVQVSECDGKIYVLFVQYNDFPNGVYDDCASRSTSEYFGSANGDLYVVVSSDGGTTWDSPRDLTNSRTPGCEPGVSGDCESDAWPSMTRYGRANIGSEDWSGSVMVDPSGTFTGAPGEQFLDVQFLNDRDPGGYAAGANPQGTQQLSNMLWFRLACVEPVPSAQISLDPSSVDLPTWVKPGEFLDMPLTILNSGNVPLTYTPTVIEDNGNSGWLAVTGLSGNVPSGLSNVEVGTLHLNNGGVQNTEAVLTGRVQFTSNAPNTVNLEVRLVVVDTIVATAYDTVAGYLALSVASDGSYGHYTSKANMDFVYPGVDCDTTATNYLGEASPIILHIDGADTLIAASLFLTNAWLQSDGLKPMAAGLTEPASGSGSGYNWYSTGTFVTPDSTLAFEQTFYAPTASGANYMVKSLKVWSHDGAAHSGIRIGDAIDWDIPSDSGSDNLSGIDPLTSRNLIYEVGTEFDTDDTTGNTDCISSDTRFGGMAFLKSMLNGVDDQTDPYSAYTARNDSFVYPQGKLVGGQTWNNMDNSGFTVETEYTDQHMVMCYNPSMTIGANDTVVFYTSIVSVYNGTSADVATAADNAEAFAVANSYFNGPPSCCIAPERGDFNVSGGDPDISDLVALVNFMFKGGTASTCPEEADVNGSGGDPDISDLVALVNFMFKGGAHPALCP